MEGKPEKFGSPKARGFRIFPIWKQVFQANLWVCLVSSYCEAPPSRVPRTPQRGGHTAKMNVVAGDCIIQKIHHVAEEDQIGLKGPWWLISNLHEEHINTVLLIALVSVIFSIYFPTICFFWVCPFVPVSVNTESTQTRLETSYKGNIKTDGFQSS